MGLIISMCIYIYIYSNYTVFMFFASTVSGDKTRYTCGGGRKGRDGRRGNCCYTEQLSSNPHFLHWWNAPSDCFYYLRKKVPIQNLVVLKWSFYRHKKIFPYPSVWFLFFYSDLATQMDICRISCTGIRHFSPILGTGDQISHQIAT